MKKKMHEISNFMNFNVSKVSVMVSVSVSRYFRKPVPLTVSPIETKSSIGISITDIILKYL
jgi:hypothetical protein